MPHPSDDMTVRALCAAKQVITMFMFMDKEQLVAFGEEMIRYTRGAQSEDTLVGQLFVRMADIYAMSDETYSTKESK